jgi:uncharacterized protein (DUF488 family)
VSPATLFTVGYAGRSPEELVELLTDAGVRRVVDIRYTPWSRSRGFSRTALAETLRSAGIAYDHVRDLGNPPEIRELWKAGDPEGRARYRALLEGEGSPAVDALAERATAEPTAILCVERDPALCHRAIVAEVAVARRPMQVRHLGI